MPRQAREVSYKTSSCFHVLVQGIAKEYIFAKDSHKNFYIKLLGEKQKKHGVSILAFCIMGNHAHVLVYSENKTGISKLFQEINVIYAQFFNREQKRVGFVFRNRFRTEPIIGEGYLLNCISYIHNNPVKAKIVECSTDYSFSSAKGYESKTGIVSFDTLKMLFGGVPETKNTQASFLDDEFEGKVDFDQALHETMRKLEIKDKAQLKSEALLKQFITEIKQNTKISLRELSLRLEINRERIRRAVSVATSL